VGFSSPLARAGVGTIRQDRPDVGLVSAAPPKTCQEERRGLIIRNDSLRFKHIFYPRSVRRAVLPRKAKYLAPVDDATIGTRLRALRQRRGLKQVEVAQKLGVHQTHVPDYERGTVRVHGPVLAALAAILRTSTDEILGVKQMKSNGTPPDRRFIRRLERIDHLPKRAKQALLSTIDTYLDGVEAKKTRT